MSNAHLRTSVRRRLATLALASLVASACAEGGAFGPLPDDRVYVMAASTPVVLSSWNDGKYYGERVLTADTLILRADGTGEGRAYAEQRREVGTTQSVSRRIFTYTRGTDRITLKFPWQCSDVCTLIGRGTENLSLIDGVLHRDYGVALVPYRRID